MPVCSPIHVEKEYSLEWSHICHCMALFLFHLNPYIGDKKRTWRRECGGGGMGGVGCCQDS